MSQRLEEERDGDGGSRREHGVAHPVPDQRSDADDDDDIHRGECCGQQAVDDRAIDDQVDVVEPVPQDGDRDRAGDPDQECDLDAVERNVRDRRQVTRAGDQGAERDRLRGEGHRAGERKPLDLMTFVGLGRPVPDHERHERRGCGRDHDKHRRHEHG
jgi:hypothetical protein